MKKIDENLTGAVKVKQLVSQVSKINRNEVLDVNSSLYSDIKKLIEETRYGVAQTINAGITAMYWNIGKKINDDILRNKRAEYGKQIIELLSKQLTEEYGAGWSTKQIRHCLRFVETFPDFKNVSSVWRQLSWTHFKTIIYINNELQREFYTQMCCVEMWSVRELRKKIDSMLFERTAISKKPDDLARLELKKLGDGGELSPDLVFKNPYVLDFLNLKDTYQEKDLEMAILKEIELFILELGRSFTFVERQKRMIIDNDDFYLDLLFYHRKLKRLIAIELKLGKFKASYKGQMELYLNWLEKHEMEDGEESPIGLILCAESGKEQIELLQLEKSNIKVAEYITKILPKELLKKKLHKFYLESKNLIESRFEDE
ncbi:MAG: PDDEXK nuclease domain-containing protein [Candidatus Methanoperedens sp.]|nr:PDDEXK nuclease domain-containing protein [Candidatus Methanoperedens sp.]